MEVFVEVVDAGNFTRAAEHLHLPKATVTTLVQGLEAHLKVKLLNRTTRRVIVTADGAAYYERCMRILAEVEETEHVLARTASSPRGRLRVDVPASFGRNLLIPALGDFFARYPDIRLELGCSDRVVDLIEEGVDCVVRGGELPDSSLVARRVATLEFITCATPDYLSRFGVPQHPRDLARHKCVNYFSARTGKMYDWDFARDDERIVLPVAGYIAVNDSDAHLAAGRTGLGIIQAAAAQVKRDLENGTLVQVLADWKSTPLGIYVMYPQNRHLSAKVRVFVDWVAEILAQRASRYRAASEASV